MEVFNNYVLVLSQASDDLHLLQSLFRHLRYSMMVADSEDEAVQQIHQAIPSLVILVGDRHAWSQSLLNRLRSIAKSCNLTIVALTDCHTPSWLPQEENPGFDGFLVKPISGEILMSLVQSAWVRKTFSLAS